MRVRKKRYGWTGTYLCCEDVDEYFVGERDAEYAEIVRVRDDAGELVENAEHQR
jgi:hypothetical protein